MKSLCTLSRLGLALCAAFLSAQLSAAASGEPSSYPVPKSYQEAYMYRSGAPFASMGAIPKDVEKLRSSDPSGYLAGVCKIINSGAKNEFEKAKMAHDFVALTLTYDADSYYGRRRSVPPQDWESVLKGRMALCQGYCDLYKKVVELLGMQCVKVEGYGRGAGVLLEQEDDVSLSNHEWNLVKVGGAWYHVDCTWDSGAADGRGFSRGYKTDYLFTMPEHFIYRHFPKNPRQQLLQRPLSEAEFGSLPSLSPMLFDAAHVGREGLSKVNPAGDSFSFKYILREGCSLRFVTLDSDGAEVRNTAFVRRNEENFWETDATIRFPKPGLYKTQVFCYKDGSYLGYGGEFLCYAEGASPSLAPAFYPPAYRAAKFDADAVLSGMGKEGSSLSMAFLPYDGYDLSFEMRDSSGAEVPYRVLVRPSEKVSGAREALFQFPGAGEYDIDVFCRKGGGPAEHAGRLAFAATKGSATIYPDLRQRLYDTARFNVNTLVKGINSVQAALSFKYALNAGQDVAFVIRDSAGREVQKSLFVRSDAKNPAEREAVFQFPKAGEYKIDIFCYADGAYSGYGGQICCVAKSASSAQYPDLRQEFYDSAKFDVKALLDNLNSAKGSLSLKYTLNSGRSVAFVLRDSAGKEVKDAAFVRTNGNKAASKEALFQFPKAGTYKIDIFCYSKGAYAGYGGQITCAAGEASGVTYPVMYSEYKSRDAELLSPVEGPLSPGSKYQFKIRLPGATQAYLIEDSGKWHEMKNSGGTWSLDYALPKGVSDLGIYAKFDKAEAWVLKFQCK